MAERVAGPEIERLIQLLARLPGLGPRSARRAALHLIRKREELFGPLTDAMQVARERIVVCTACGKPMGAKPVIDSMLAKLAGHSMFATPEALARLTQCADCRVIDLITKEKSLNAWELTE